MSIFSTIMGIVIKIINKLSSKIISPKCKHLVWLIFVLSLIFPISIYNKFSIYNYTYVIRAQDLCHIYNSNNLFENLTKLQEQDNFFMININTENNLKVFHTIMYIWLIIMILKSFFKINTIFEMNKLLGKEEIKDKRIIKVFENCKKDLGIKRKIKLINPINQGLPGICGVINVKIIINENIAKFTNKDLKNIFMHELSHYKRKDNILLGILSFLEIIYWFNPIILLCISDIKNNLEFATDEMAINQMKEVEYKDYCRTIVKIINNGRLPKSCELGLINNTESLIKRVNFIANKDENEKMYKFKYFATCIISILILLFLTPTVYSSDNNSNLCINVSNNNYYEFNEHNIDKLSELHIFSDDNVRIWNENHNYIVYQNLTANDCEKLDEVEMIILNFEKGEFLYKFKLKEYQFSDKYWFIKFIVE